MLVEEKESQLDFQTDNKTDTLGSTHSQTQALVEEKESQLDFQTDNKTDTLGSTHSQTQALVEEKESQLDFQTDNKTDTLGSTHSQTQALVEEKESQLDFQTDNKTDTLGSTHSQTQALVEEKESQLDFQTDNKTDTLGSTHSQTQALVEEKESQLDFQTDNKTDTLGSTHSQTQALVEEKESQLDFQTDNKTDTLGSTHSQTQALVEEKESQLDFQTDNKTDTLGSTHSQTQALVEEKESQLDFQTDNKTDTLGSTHSQTQALVEEKESQLDFQTDNKTDTLESTHSQTQALVEEKESQLDFQTDNKTDTLGSTHSQTQALVEEKESQPDFQTDNKTDTLGSTHSQTQALVEEKESQLDFQTDNKTDTLGSTHSQTQALVEEKESQLDFQTDNKTDTLGSTHIEDKGVDYTQDHISVETTSPMPREGKKPNPECRKANNPHRLEFKHIEAKGIGYNQGYTSFDAFFTGVGGSYVPFLDVRAHVFNDGKWAVNTGIGTRYILDPCHSMVGANIYYDYRSANHDRNLSQLGAGLEAFYNRFEARINGYLPFGQKRKRIETHLDSLSFKRFSGNYILMNEHYNNTYQGAMKGFNAEVGAHLYGNRKEYDLYFGIGPYYYDVSDGKHSWGGKARLKAEVTKYVFLEISDSYDSIFHNRFQGSVNLSIPFGARYCYANKMKTSCENVMDWQAVLPVERQEIIVVSKFKKKQTIDPVAIDPSTGKPFYVVFVNNTNTSLGNGTFENPYQNLTTNDNATSAQSGSFTGNTIYVFEGDGTETHMSGGNMVLLANQRLLGSGNPHQYQTTKGLLTIPAQTPTYPQIVGTSNNVIVLNNNNEVSGFNITVPSGFTGVDSNTITGANVNFNNFIGGISAIALGASPATPVFGTILANNNTATSQSGGSAIIYQFGIQNADLTVINNLGQNSSGSVNIGLSVSILTSDSKSTVLVDSNIFQNLAGTSLATGMSIFDATVPGSDSIIITNNFVNNATRGFAISTTSPMSSAFIIEGNSITNTTQTATVSTTSSGVACVRFNNNIGVPSSASPPFAITGSGGLLSYEPLINNVPTPTPSGNVVQVPACTCAPCP